MKIINDIILIYLIAITFLGVIVYVSFKLYEGRIERLNKGVTRLLFILSVLIPIVPAYQFQLDLFHRTVDAPFLSTASVFMIAAFIIYCLFWIVVKIVLWVIDGFNNSK